MKPETAKRLFELDGHEVCLFASMSIIGILKSSFPNMKNEELQEMAKSIIEVTLETLPNMMPKYLEMLDQDVSCLN